MHDSVVLTGWVPNDTFLAGYGAAQALPGPLFSIGPYLGFVANPAHPLSGALLALCGIFLPGLLIVVAALPLWNAVGRTSTAAAVTRGAGAAVVGVLAAAFATVIVPSALLSVADVVIAAVGFLLLLRFRAPSWAVAMGIVAASAIVAQWGG